MLKSLINNCEKRSDIALVFKAFFVGIYLASCGTVEERKKDIQDSFLPFLESFEVQAQKRGYSLDTTNLIMKFGEIDQSQRQIALCISFVPGNDFSAVVEKRSDWKRVFGSGSAPEVIVPEQTWTYLSDTQKEITLFHELGHCILSLDHDDTKPAIMNTTILDFRAYQANKDKLIDELFQAYFTNRYKLKN